MTTNGMTGHPSDEMLTTWLEREPDDGEEVWQHLFACDACTKRADDLRVVITSLRELGRTAHVPLPTRAMLAVLERRGTSLQHVTGIPGGKVEVAIGNVDVLAMHVPIGDQAGEVDVHLCRPDGEAYFKASTRSEDGEIVVACHRSIARANPALRVRVLHEERVLFDGIFANAPEPLAR